MFVWRECLCVLTNVLFEQWVKTCSFSAVRDTTVSIFSNMFERENSTFKCPPWTWPQPGSPCRWARRTLGRWRMGIWCHCQANLDGWNQDRVIFLRAIRQGYLRPELQQDQDGEGHSSSLLMSIIRTRKERGIFEFPSLPASVSTWGTQSRR